MKKYFGVKAATLFVVGLLMLASNISSAAPHVNYTSITNFSNSSNTSNYTNSSNSSNSTNQDTYYPDPIYGSLNLTVDLPDRNVSLGPNMSIYVYNATFYGNSSTYGDNFRGRIYARYEVKALKNESWYSYFTYFSEQVVVYDAFSAYSCNEYYNYTLLEGNVELRDLLFSYYWTFAQPAILQAINGSSSNSSNATQYLPDAYLTGYNLSEWYNASWWVFNNFTSVGYWMSIYAANFTGTAQGSAVTGEIQVTFNAFGNRTEFSVFHRDQTSIYGFGAILKIENSWVSSIEFDDHFSLNPSDLRIFLRTWALFKAIPYLLTPNSSNTTTGIAFPEYNITGYDLNDWKGQYDFYTNYTWPGYSVYVYNFIANLQKYNDDVYGYVNLSIIAFGNDTSYPCSMGSYCPKITVYSNATIYVNGVRSNDSILNLDVDYYLRVNYTDIQNFLRGYYYAVMKPNITTYYNITKNTTTNRTIYLPNYSNEIQINIDCSRQSYYCSGAHSQSYLSFLGFSAYNLSIAVNERGDGYFNGVMQVPYTANLINFTNTYYGKETIIDSVQGNATMDLFGWVNGTDMNSYYVSLNSYANPSVAFDRNYFVQNAVQRLYSDSYMWHLQNFVNNFVSN